MSESQVTEGIVIRIAHELEILVEEMAELCVPTRRGATELRLRRSLIFGRMGDDVIWIDIHEKRDRLGRLFRMDVRDMTFEPGYVYALQQIWSPQMLRDASGDVKRVARFLSEMRAGLLKTIRKDLGPTDESA